MQQPIVQQPRAFGQPTQRRDDWMSIPHGTRNAPRGLEYLTIVDYLFIKQQVELLEAFTGFETNNKYIIQNAFGQNVYFAAEDNDAFTRNCVGSNRPFHMKILDNYRYEVIHIYKPFRFALNTMEVSAPPGNVIGTIEQEWSLYPHFRINNRHGETVLRLEGPCCTSDICCADVDFHILSMTGERVGKISKQWSGFAREIFTDADFFGINFPMDLDVLLKAVLLGATFLIDFMFYESGWQNYGG